MSLPPDFGDGPLMCQRRSQILNWLLSQQLILQQCDMPDNTLDYCYALCPNADLAGVGVRAAFYAQSVLNTLLVIFSPRDSVPSAWASTLLTGSLIIAAFVQKVQANLTLHHAILVLNFATLSCISSLAAAPLLPIWRLSPSEYYARELELARRNVGATISSQTDGEGVMLTDEFYVNTHKKKIKIAQNKERVILALALLIQVILQWAWGIFLFVSPSYYQSMCSGSTKLQFFMVEYTALEINRTRFYIWPIWLLFCLGITMGLTILLALSGPERAMESSGHTSMPSRDEGSPMPIMEQLANFVSILIPPRYSYKQQFIYVVNIIAFALWILFVISSEIQRERNCIASGEENFSGFGQITAVLLSLAPLWSLTVALYKYPYRVRKEKRRHRRSRGEELQALLNAADGSGPGSTPNPPEETVERFPAKPSTSTSVLPASESCRPVPIPRLAMPDAAATMRPAWTRPSSRADVNESGSGSLELMELTECSRTPI